MEGAREPGGVEPGDAVVRGANRVRVRAPGGYEEPYRWQLRDGAWVQVRRRALSWQELERGWTCDHR